MGCSILSAMPISIFIQTLDEEANLPGLLESVSFADDVVVLDSLSTDGTRAVAESAGARWFERAFDGTSTSSTGGCSPWTRTSG